MSPSVGPVKAHQTDRHPAQFHHAIDNRTLQPSSLPRLPVLSNIEPPALRRKTAIGRLLINIVDHEEWPVHNDVFSHATQRLTSRKQLWSNMYHKEDIILVGAGKMIGR